MLILANGAFKSGSTWQFNILEKMTSFSAIPEAYRQDWINPSIGETVFATFLNEVDIRNEDYISKNHFAEKSIRDLIFSNPNIRVFNIYRDLRDVLVSAYYHNTRDLEVKPDFQTFYYTRGRIIAHRVLSYHQLWASPNSPNYFLGSYEALHYNFRAELIRMAEFLDIPLNVEQIDAIEASTTIEKLRQSYGEENKEEEKRFFRKGQIGDWQEHFDGEMLKDLAKIEKEFRETSFFYKRIQKYFLRLWRAL